MVKPLALPRALQHRAQNRPHDPLLRDVDGEQYTAGETYELALRWASMLSNFGVGPQETVATMLSTRAMGVIAWLGAALDGALDVPINPDYRGTMLRDALTSTAAKILVIEHRLLPRLVPLADELPKLERLIVVDGEGEELGYLPWKITDAHSVLQQHHPHERSAPNPESVACGIFTSGTTGLSKCVLVSWNHIRDMYGTAIPLGNNPRAVGYAHTPLHHLVARGLVYRAIARPSGSVVLKRKLDSELFWDEVREFECTETITTEVVGKWLSLARPRPDDADNPLQLMVMAPLMPEPERFSERFGVELMTVYGSTEAGIPFASQGIPADPHSCGRLVRGAEVRVVDHQRPEYDLPPGHTGELLVRTPGPATSRGYFMNSEATEQSWNGEWFRTGDAFRVDNDGNWFCMGRYKDMIRRRGENISAVEIEREVATFAGVAQSAAIGVACEFGEEEVKVFVEAEPGYMLDLEMLASHLESRLPRFMVPRYYEQLESLPTGPTAKVNKLALRKLPVLAVHTFEHVAVREPRSAPPHHLS